MEDKLAFQDIIGFVEVQVDYGTYLFVSIYFIIVTSIVFLLVNYLKVKRKSPKKKNSPLKNLKKINFENDDSKEILYQFTINAKLLSKGKPSKKLQEILEEIEPLKYQKENIELDENIKEKLKRYIDGFN